jgi:GTPase SAR1 family protein
MQECAATSCPNPLHVSVTPFADLSFTSTVAELRSLASVTMGDHRKVSVSIIGTAGCGKTSLFHRCASCIRTRARNTHTHTHTYTTCTHELAVSRRAHVCVSSHNNGLCFRRFITGKYSATPTITVGMDFSSRMLTVRDPHTGEMEAVRVDVWDTAGMERFRSSVNSLYRAKDAILIAYDLTSVSTFEDAQTMAPFL